MRPWLLMLAGLLSWAVHFTGLYVIVSLQDLAWPDDHGPWRLASAVLTAACASACLVTAAISRRHASSAAPGSRHLMAQLGVLGSGLGGVAVAWQGLAVLVA